jgi:hypothetical protein
MRAGAYSVMSVIGVKKAVFDFVEAIEESQAMLVYPE